MVEVYFRKATANLHPERPGLLRFKRSTDLRERASTREFEDQAKRILHAWDGRLVMEHRHMFLTRPQCDDAKKMLADAATDIEATRLLTWAAAARMDAGEDATLAAAHAKKYAARAACRAIGDCMQVLGANGFRQDQPVARHLANARMAHFIDGTTEIQNVVIGRALRSPARR